MSKATVTNIICIAGIVGVVAIAVLMRGARQEAPAEDTRTNTPVAQSTETPSPADSDTPASQPSQLPRLVDLGSDKCKACKKLAPIIEELRKEYSDRVSVVFIDIYRDPLSASMYDYRAIPTQILLDANEKEVWRHEGFISKADLITQFAQVGVE